MREITAEAKNECFVQKTMCSFPAYYRRKTVSGTQPIAICNKVLKQNIVQTNFSKMIWTAENFREIENHQCLSAFLCMSWVIIFNGIL